MIKLRPTSIQLLVCNWKQTQVGSTARNSGLLSPAVLQNSFAVERNSKNVRSFATPAELRVELEKRGKLKQSSSNSPKNSSPSQTTQTYCRELVRNAEYENYLCTLLLPVEIRSAAFAIRAFNVELAQIRDKYTDKVIGQMRIQFWRNTLEKVYTGKRPAAPAAIELDKAVKAFNLSKSLLSRLIESRADLVEDKALPNLEAVERYSENSVTPIFYLLLESLGRKAGEINSAADHLGKATGLVTVLRSFPYHLQRGQVQLPVDLMIKHKLSPEIVSRIFRHSKNPSRKTGMPLSELEIVALQNVIYEIAARAKQHVESSQNFILNLPAAVRPVYLPIVCCDLFLRKLQRVNFDIFNSLLSRRDGLLAFKLWWRNNHKVMIKR